MAGSRSLFDQLTQIRASRTYDDAVADIETVAESQEHLEGDLNVIRTILKAVKGTANWFDDSTAGADLETLKERIDALTVGLGDKVVETIVVDIPAETVHILPDAKTYTPDPLFKAQNMDLFYNGQLLISDSSAILNDGDYEEVDSTHVKFHMVIEADSNIIYLIRQ